jgi:Ca-activated chloride channel family protein
MGGFVSKLIGNSLPPGAAVLVILALTSAASGAGSAIAPHPAGRRGAAQEPQTQPRPEFSTRVTQVEVYATVTGPDGRAVKGLTESEFTVLEDTRPQKITAFVAGEFPAAVALAVDRSFSMKGTPLTMARTAGRAFVASLKPDDRAMLISISGDVEVLAPLDTNKQALLTALDALDPWSTTSLNDAVIRSIDLLEGETGRRAIVVLSDGVDRYSKARDADVVDRARRSDVLLYPIAIGRVRPPLFAEIASVSGGRSFHLRDAKNLQSTLQTIVEDLRSQYLIGYEPSEPWPTGEDEWRSITVKVNRSGVQVRARSGYSTK